MPVIYTESIKETQRAARMLAEELQASRPGRDACIIALSGELGAGKTTFAQGFAAALGVKEKIKSPTFVLMKIYALTKSQRFKHLVHLDCYRLQNSKDLIRLGVTEILRDRDAVILIEWADRVKKILPCDAIWVRFMHGAKQHERYIKIDGGVSFGRCLDFFQLSP